MFHIKVQIHLIVFSAVVDNLLDLSLLIQRNLNEILKVHSGK